jgi:hypothetical protein
LCCVKEEWDRRDKVEYLLKGEIELNNEDVEAYKDEIIQLKAKLYDYLVGT